MQTKKKIDVKKIVKMLILHLNANDIKGLADKLGVKKSTIYAWIKNGSIGNAGKILAICPEISLSFLETGEGELLINDKPAITDTIDTEEKMIAERISRLEDGQKQMKEDLSDIKTWLRLLAGQSAPEQKQKKMS